MARCANCQAVVLFGGKSDGARRYCNDACREQGRVALVAGQVPAELLQQRVSEVHAGKCPRCGGDGPVDVHVSHSVVSFLVATRWSSRPIVACRPCGNRAKIGDSIKSLLLGWWGVPWGFVMTPVQIGHNLVGMCRAPDPSRPSALLEATVRQMIAAEAIATEPPAAAASSATMSATPAGDVGAASTAAKSAPRHLVSR